MIRMQVITTCRLEGNPKMGARLKSALAMAAGFAICGAFLVVVLNQATILAEVGLTNGMAAGLGAALGAVLGFGSILDNDGHKPSNKRIPVMPTAEVESEPLEYDHDYDDDRYGNGRDTHSHTNGYDPDRWFSCSKDERDFMRDRGMSADEFDSNVRDDDRGM